MKTAFNSFQTSSGVQLPYVEQGDPDGLPVILLHGYSDSWHSFDLALPHLPDWLHVFAVTQRGHGDAGKPQTGYQTADFARDLQEFVTGLNLEQAILVGHSLGATNALRFAIDYPDRLAGLVLVAGFSNVRRNATLVEFWEQVASQLVDPVSKAFVREFQESTFAQDVPAKFLETVIGESLKVPARIWRAAFAGFMEDVNLHEFENVTVPTMILWGAHDVFAPREDQDELIARLPTARLKIYNRCGHAPHWEEPEHFADDLVEFARSVAEQTAAERTVATHRLD